MNKNAQTEYVAHHVFSLCLYNCGSQNGDDGCLCEYGTLSNYHEQSPLVNS